MNKKLRDTVLVIASIITIICVVVGALINTKDIFRGYNGISFGGKNYNDEKKLDDELREVIITMDMGDITIEKGDENAVYISSNKATAPAVTYEKGVLTLNAEEKVRITPFGKEAADVTIIVKDDIENIDITVDMGSVEISGVNAKNLSTNLDMGDVQINGGTITNVTAKVELGDLEVEDVDFSKSKFDGSAGDFEIKLPFAEDEYSFDLNVDLGCISVGDSETGNNYKNTKGERVIETSLDMGDIEISF